MLKIIQNIYYCGVLCLQLKNKYIWIKQNHSFSRIGTC
jgi:hypothetical protein